jgi:hypothetical protein
MLTLIVVIMGVMIFIYPPAIFPDPSNGYQVMRSMEMGGGFNRLVSPDQDDISKNTSLFLTWWSPGQYLVPYSIKFLGVNTGQATAIAISLLELSGLFGLYSFFKKIGFTPMITAISLVFIACQQAFITPYIFYNGGEILLFGYAGWFLYGCLVIKKADWKLLVFVLLSGWVGFFCKSSFLWMYAAGMLCLWLRLSAVENMVTISRLIKNGTWLAIPAVISLACIYIFFLSKGENPAAASTGISLNLQTFTFPLGAPLISSFSVDELMHGLVFPAFSPFLSPLLILIILVLLAILSVAIVFCIFKYVPKNNYRLFVLVFYAVAVLFFTTAYIRQLNISYESRHFRILGLLIAPGIIYLISKLKPAYWLCFGVLCTTLMFFNYSYFARAYLFNKNISARGNTGLAQEFISQPALDYILKLDRENCNAIFVFEVPDLPLEIIHNRTITVDPPLTGPMDNDDCTYYGHAGPLYILLPVSDASRTGLFMKLFPGYKFFSHQAIGKDYMMYSAK